MAASLSKPWAFYTVPPKTVNISSNQGDFKDEALSISGDSSSYSDEENIAKAARIHEPTRRNWASPEVTFPSPSFEDEEERGWSTADAAALYNVAGWSEGYFDVLSDGHLAVKPQGGD